jgi:threonine dehydratase
MIDVKQEVLAAEKRIRPYIRETPLEYSLALSQKTKCQVYLKCENFQYTGAFKVRGAFNKLLTLTPDEQKQGIVTASSGNHGTAVAYSIHQLPIPGLIFLPENASSAKIANIRNFGIPLEFYGTDCMHTEMHARDYAKQYGKIYISPYNDSKIIAGQGTIAVELTRQLAHIDVVLVPVGGGGLISGIAGYIKGVNPDIKVIGCLPENSPVMAASIKAGKIIDMETLPTLSDATAGGIEHGTITFEICQQFVDDYILVTENEIKSAIIETISSQHMLIEPAAGVAVASLLKNSEKFQGLNVVVILCGANVSLNTLKDILAS